MPRLTTVSKSFLKTDLLRYMRKWPNDFQTALEWQQSNFLEYTPAQVKLALDSLYGEGEIKRNKVSGKLYYGIN